MASSPSTSSPSYDSTSPTTFLRIFRQMNFVFITINVEHVKFSFPFVCDFGDRYYSNLKKKKNKL